MKKVVLALTALAVAQVSSAVAEENLPHMEDGTAAGIEETALVIPESEARLHGTLKSLIEYEGWRYDRRGQELGMRNGGKFKFVLAEGNFRHDSLPGWDFGFHSAREDIFFGNPTNQIYDLNNSIMEIYANRNYDKNWGNIGYGVKLASESADNRYTPEFKVFGSYNLTSKLKLQGYGLYNTELKRDIGEFRFWEIEPGFGYQISDNMGAWINFRYQEGNWHPQNNAASREFEKEWIIKPGVWRSFGKLGVSAFAEIGKFTKTEKSSGRLLWVEDYVKVGFGSSYQFARNWNVFGEVSYKSVEFENTDRQNFDGYLPLAIVGIGYNF